MLDVLDGFMLVERVELPIELNPPAEGLLSLHGFPQVLRPRNDGRKERFVGSIASGYSEVAEVMGEVESLTSFRKLLGFVNQE